MNKRIYKKGDKKILRAWAFYDWANSVYPLVIGTAVFPIFYGELFVESDYIDFLGINYKNTALIQHITSLVFLLLAFLILKNQLNYFQLLTKLDYIRFLNRTKL